MVSLVRRIYFRITHLILFLVKLGALPKRGKVLYY